MPRFRYSAMNAKGEESEGVLDAADHTEAVSSIKSRGLFPVSIQPLGTGAETPKGGRTAATRSSPRATVNRKAPSRGLHMEIDLPRFLGGGVRLKQLMVFTRQLATLVEAGLPLLRGLRILLQQEKNVSLRKAVTGMSEAVEGGSTFSEALSMYPKIFDQLFVNMVKAGEAGGVLEVVLKRLAEFMEKADRIRRKVKAAMIYPVVVMLFAVGILSFLLIRIIPSFETIFVDLLGRRSMPPLTQFVINCSDFMRHRYLVIIGLVVLVVVSYRMLQKVKKGRFYTDYVKLKLPLFGALTVKTAVARFGRTLGTLMAAGVPVLQALNIVRDTTGNAVIAKAIQSVHDAVKEGDSMCQPMEAARVFPSMVISMVDVGEETGALPDMLLRIADNYEDEVDTAVEGLTSVIEPIMIVFLALIVGTIVIAMFVPLITIIADMS